MKDPETEMNAEKTEGTGKNEESVSPEHSTIYSRLGDDGETDLFPWGRISKTSPRMEALGTLDELNAWLGVIRAHVSGYEICTELEKFQRILFRVSSELSCPVPALGPDLQRLTASEISDLEVRIDRMDAQLAPLAEMLCFGGNPAASFAQLARSVCRRAERRVLTLRDASCPVSPAILRWLNRFSDYLFVLGRFLNENKIQTENA